MTDCIFCKIIEDQIPSAKVYEDEDVYAFLDITQVTPGHTLVIPKTHVANIFEYDEDLATKVMTKLPKISRAVRRAFPDMLGLNILNNNGQAAGQTVFHSHIHLIPRYQGDGDGFGWSFADNSKSYTSEEFSARAAAIASALAQEEEA